MMLLKAASRPFVHAPLPPVPLLERVDGGEFRVYRTPSGEMYPSVTSVLGAAPHPELDAWRARVGETEARRVSLEATSRGTAIHAIAEAYLNNETQFHASPIYISEFQPLRRMLDSDVGTVLSTETPLYSDRLRVAGTTDCIAHFDGTLSLIDFKTSRRRKQRSDIGGYFMQGAAYAMMAYERTGVVIRDIVILMLVDGVECMVFKEKVADHMGPFVNLRKTFKEMHSL